MKHDPSGRITALALLALASAACGEASSSAPRTLPSSPELTVMPIGSVIADTLLPPGALIGARTGPDGRSLVVFFVGAAEYTAGDPCTARYTAEVEEAADEVRISIRTERPASAAPVACALVGFPRSLAADLAEPLAARSLIALGQPTEVFDGAMLAAPGWTPDGWSVASESPGLLEGGATTWTRAWTPEIPDGAGACPLGSSGLALLEGEPDVVDGSFATDGVEPSRRTTSTGRPRPSGTRRTVTSRGSSGPSVSAATRSPLRRRARATSRRRSTSCCASRAGSSCRRRDRFEHDDGGLAGPS